MQFWVVSLVLVLTTIAWCIIPWVMLAISLIGLVYLAYACYTAPEVKEEDSLFYTF